jgi:hypothetical protein
MVTEKEHLIEHYELELAALRTTAHAALKDAEMRAAAELKRCIYCL